jgi:hypothetical protein
MATAKPKAKTKPKTEKKAAPAPKKSSAVIDLSHLNEKAAKQVAHFLEKAKAKRHVEGDKILAACLHYCATLSQRRHGIHYVLQMIEQTTRCKIK